MQYARKQMNRKLWKYSGAWVCNHCGNLEMDEREVVCWMCGKGEMCFTLNLTEHVNFDVGFIIKLLIAQIKLNRLKDRCHEPGDLFLLRTIGTMYAEQLKKDVVADIKRYLKIIWQR